MNSFLTTQRFLFAAGALCAILPAHAATQDVYVHGSWVNVRAAAVANAPVRAQLSANTKLTLLARENSWCSVKTGAGVEGWLPCELTGTAPLTLAQAAGKPAREFWVAPSFGRLVKYGELVRSGAQYKRMYGKLKQDDVARIQAMPEFDAAKAMLQAGVQPSVASELEAREPVKPEAMFNAKALLPKPIKPSLFKQQSDLALLSEGDADTLAAVAKSRVSLKVLGPPKAYIAPHDGPEISGLTGFGDVGKGELNFSPALTVYLILNNGLISADQLPKQRLAGEGPGDGCGEHYEGTRNYGPTWYNHEVWPTVPVKGFAKRSDTAQVLVALVTASPLEVRKARVTSRVAKLNSFVDPVRREGAIIRPSKTLGVAKVALHEIDLDNDGVADILLWENPSIGGVTGEYTVARAWYVNIGGQWFAAGTMVDEECT